MGGSSRHHHQAPAFTSQGLLLWSLNVNAALDHRLAADGKGLTVAAAKNVDWELVERHYRAGLLSLRQIADEAGGVVTEGAIRKRAKLNEWTRDLKAKIAQRAEDLVRKEQVRAPSTQMTPATEKQVVEANARAAADVLIRHKTTATRMSALVLAMLAECEAQSEDPTLFEELGEIMRRPDDNNQDRLNDAYRKATGLPQRIKGVKELADTLKVLIGIEREAYGIDTKDGAVPEHKPMGDVEAANRIAFIISQVKDKDKA